MKDRHAVAIDVTEFPQAGVSHQPLPMVLHEGGQVRAADLLLAFQDPAHATGKLAAEGEQRIDGEEPGREMPLVVADAAADEAVPDSGGLEGRARPELERLGRLHVVMVVDEEGAIAGAVPFGKDDGESLDAGKLDAEAARAEHVGDERRAVVHALPLGRDARLRDETAELVQAPLEAGFHLEVQRAQRVGSGTHAGSLHGTIGLVERAG